MEYISKSTLTAEIKKRIKETEFMQPKFDQFWAGQISAFKSILKILNTLETKDNSLEKFKSLQHIEDLHKTLEDWGICSKSLSL